MIATEWRKSSHSADTGDCVEIAWRKSSHSGATGDCVEIGWHKSSHSGSTGNCVEIGHQPTGVAVRDSKNAAGPTLAFPNGTWQTFLSRIA